MVLKSVATLLHPKRQIACSVKLCVKCKIPRLPAQIDTASPQPQLPNTLPPSLPLCLYCIACLCGARFNCECLPLFVSLSLIAPTHNSLARPLVRACMCVCVVHCWGRQCSTLLSKLSIRTQSGRHYVAVRRHRHRHRHRRATATARAFFAFATF